MPLNIDIQQIFLHLLNFVVLFAILYFLLYKPVRDFMHKRAEYYQDLDQKTKENYARSESAKSEDEEKLSAADDEIMELREKAQDQYEAWKASRK